MRATLFRAEVVAVVSICVSALLIVIVPIDADSGEARTAQARVATSHVASASIGARPPGASLPGAVPADTRPVAPHALAPHAGTQAQGHAPDRAGVWPPSPAPVAERADEIRVDKSERRMRLLRGGHEIRSYRILLGDAPVGHKRQQGDERTPEGDYRISGRNPRSRFHLSLRVSYPAAADRAQARARGVDPGGDIMIHGGTPPGYTRDWTDGCIAVTDTEIEEIWRLVPDGTPIRIAP